MGTEFDNLQDKVTFICDQCGYSEGMTGYKFMEAVHHIKELGWKIYKDEDDGSWIHYCPDCRH